MLKRIIYIITLIVFLIPTSIHANEEVSTLAKNWFTTFSKNIRQKNSPEKEILYFEWFSTKLNDLVTVKKFNTAQINLLNDLRKISNERVFEMKKSILENWTKIILRTNSLINDFKYFSYNTDNIFLENWVRYTYKYDTHLTFPKWTNIRLEDLIYNWINKETSLVFLREDNSLWFANKYTKVKLISDNIIYWIPDKYNFLREIKNDKKSSFSESDNDFINLKNLTLKLTEWKKESEKIKIIYDYVLNNIEYPKNFSLSDPKIFSGIDTFVTKKWICEGYTKTLLYMLNFSWINDSEVIRWYVLDAQDFPKIWHAWIKIRDNYYDPTFDDPIGQTVTKKFSEYKFFWLPYDLFYTNRFTFDKLPIYLKEESVDARKAFIATKIAPMVYKYRYSGYNLLKPYILKLDNWININKKLDIEDLKKIMGYYEVNNFTFKKSGTTKTISGLKYYNVVESEIDNIVEQLNYTFTWYYLFKWKLDNWSYEYRLAYDVELK